VSGNWDATLKLVYAVDDNQFFAVDTVEAGKAFDVIANLEIGKELMGFVSGYDLFVAVRNLTQSTSPPQLSKNQSVALTPSPNALNQEERINFASGWTGAKEGDVLEVIASLKVKAGIHTDYSLATSEPFMISA
jgi:hypothetical protein